MADLATLRPLDVALRYAARGLPVFPCHPCTKAPLTPQGFKSAATARDGVAALWAAHPRAMVGIPTGAGSGVFVLDLDTCPDTGTALGEAWLASVGLSDLLNGPGAQTPRGGRHVYFRADGLAQGLGNTGGRIAPKVDTRGNGGYIIAPGSRRADGRAYLATHGGLEVALPPLPDGLARALDRKPKVLRPEGAPRARPGGPAPDGLAEVMDILAHIPPDCGYDDWLAVLMGLHSRFNGSDAALSLAEDWSAKGAKFRPGEVASKWRTFAPDGGTGWPSVCKLAEINGADLAAIARHHKGASGFTPAYAAQRPTPPLEWPAPDARYLRPELPPPPALPVGDVFSPDWARWINGAAMAKSAPPDYIAAALLSVAGAMIGNTRWASPWDGWSEPPIIWAMAIGQPSMNKSPGFDAVLGPLRKLEGAARRACDATVTEWRDRAEVAKLAEAAWKEAVKAAIKQGEDAPAKPREADPGPEPKAPRYVVTDATVEKLGVILAGQPRGALLFRDELAGWLQGMTRYSGGGSDRPFWLEAYGGRAYPVERMGRDPVHVDHLSVGVLGGIQPDRLKTLLFKSDDDGLLARFLPIWPHAAPINRPMAGVNDGFLVRALERLLALQMPVEADGTVRPWIVPFAPDAADLFQTYREAVREWEQGAEGLLLSFIGKLPGLAARVALVLAHLDYAATGQDAPQSISVNTLGRAAHFIEAYALPMARRAYADASIPKGERAARRLAAIILERRLARFTTREILQMERAGLRSKAELDPALGLLEEAAIIRRHDTPPGPKGGAPVRAYEANPALWSAP